MHPEFPIERVCSHRHEPFQLTFAREAIQLLPHSEDAEFEAHRQGLVLRAETESALERPIEILQQHYGDQLHIGSLTVRLHRGVTVEEPHMGVRVLCASNHFEAVKADLERRGAAIVEAVLTAQYGIVHATAPLAALLGFPRRVATLTDGRAREVMWLSHYAPVEPPPPGNDAA